VSRLYVPATLSLLADWVGAGVVAESAALEAVVAEDDSEDAEYAALVTAADASADLGGRRRVVLVLETAVASGPVPMSDVVACHVDTTDRPLTGADPHDDQDDDPDDDLAWYAPQEIPSLLA
jgi:hypothetical protein